MTAQNLKISEIEVNKGQVPGLPKNPRFIKDERFKALVKSIQDAPEMLNLRELLVYPHNGKYVVIGGNMRLRACKELGYKEVPCKILDASTDVAKLREYTIKDNNAFGSTDWDLIANEWECSELEEWGMEIPDVEFSGEEEEKEIVEDEAPAVDEVEPVCKKGDIWQLGRHRLMCGDSTDKECVDKLMNGEVADIAFSSPPYNAGTTATETAMGKKTKYNGNDDNKSETEYIDFLSAYIEQAIKHSKYVFMNVQSISNNKLALIDVLYRNKDIYADTIIWDKIHGQPAMAENVMNSVFEYVHIFSQKANRAIGTLKFRGTVDNVLHLQSQRKNEYSDIHNATFSVEFASHFIRNFAKKSVLEQFGGTGTTLIACEQLNRTCYIMELDPKYCDVIIARWEKLTNQKATKIN